MCGLTGVILGQQSRSKDECKKISDGFESMLMEADARGGDATGFAIIDKHGDYAICKRPLEAFSFLMNSEVQENIDLFYDDVTCLMGHTRFATKGHPSINKNNHPIRAGKTIGTHNGSIHNHKELFKKVKMNRYAQVDSEAIFRLYETSENAKDFADNRLTKVRGKVAIVWADLEFPDYVYIVKANNPFKMAFVPSLNIYIYGSLTEIIDKASLGKYELVDVKPDTMLRINTKTMKIRSRKISIEKPVWKQSYGNYDSSIGAYVDKPVKKFKFQNTVSAFVPRYSHSDQMKLFKRHTASDGSTIKKIK